MFKRQFTPPLSHDFGLGLNSEAYRDLRAPQAWGVFCGQRRPQGRRTRTAIYGHEKPRMTTKDHEKPRKTTNDHKRPRMAIKDHE